MTGSDEFFYAQQYPAEVIVNYVLGNLSQKDSDEICLLMQQNKFMMDRVIGTKQFMAYKKLTSVEEWRASQDSGLGKIYSVLRGELEL